MDYTQLVTVSLNGAETKAAAKALREAAADHRESGRPNTAADKDAYANALEASYKAFDGFTAQVTVSDGMELSNGISRGRRVDNDSLPAATDALEQLRTVIDEVMHE